MAAATTCSLRSAAPRRIEVVVESRWPPNRTGWDGVRRESRFKRMKLALVSRKDETRGG